MKQVYQELFGAALERYNDKQKRSDRKITDYYEHINCSMRSYSRLEITGTDEAKQAQAVLDEFMKDLGERNPQLRVFSAHLHMDEAAPHLHIDFVPFITESDQSVHEKGAAQGFESGAEGPRS